MAIAQVNETSSNERKLFQGIGLVKVVAVNPTKKELEKFGIIPKDEPIYISEGDVKINGEVKKVKQIRITFWVELLEEGYEKTYIPVTYFLADVPVIGSKSGKYLAINKYGTPAYLTKEEIQTKNLADNMKWLLTDGLKPTVRGEVELVEFIKNWCNLKNVSKDTPENELSNCECYLEQIKDYFSNNISELKQCVKDKENGKLKLLFGVKTTDDNKLYQNVATRLPMKHWQSDLTSLDDKLKQLIEQGLYKDTNFGDLPYQFNEFKLTPSVIKDKKSSEDEFDKLWGAE